jgi:6-phosphofructokinase 1
MSIGILTSGGDAPGMNAAVRAAFRGLKMSAPDCELILFRDGFRGLARRLDSSSDRSVDRKDVRDIIHRGGTFIGTGRVPELCCRPPTRPTSPSGSPRARPSCASRPSTCSSTQIESLIVIGGDGSFCGAQAIARGLPPDVPGRPFRVIGIPGTIDNDLHGTDFSIGYDTALNNVVDSIRKLRDTIESHRRAIILEVMGNTSGWLALQSAIAGGAAVVAIPEVEETWDQDEILRRLIAGVRRDYRYFIIVVAEGVLKRAGADWSQRLKRRIEECPPIHDSLGHAMEVRINSVGHVARGGSPVGPRQHARRACSARPPPTSPRALPLPTATRVEGDVMVGCRGHPRDRHAARRGRSPTRRERSRATASSISCRRS